MDSREGCCGGDGKAEMIPTEEALKIVLGVSNRLPPVVVSLQETLGKVLAEDICAPDPLPPYPASVKDGYAVVASDGPGEYPVITESRAGNDGLGVTVTPGTVAYVTTGGPIPDGADAVVQVEDTEVIADVTPESKRVKILIQTKKGTDIRRVGSIMRGIIMRGSTRKKKISSTRMNSMSIISSTCNIFLKKIISEYFSTSR